MQKFIVGGAVRDRLMGMSPKDVDFVVVGATPAEMLAQGFKQVGADFPVFLDEMGNEFALARTERKSGQGYNGFVTDHSPEVTLEQDLERRDLTINAMAWDSYVAGQWAKLVDPFGGYDDLKNKVLRHVSEAFGDDPVRVLRLARFLARFGPEWKVAPETLELCRKMVKAHELDFLTRERVLKEMEKALSEPYAHLFFEFLDKCGALMVVFPELRPSLMHACKLLNRFKTASASFKFALLVFYMRDRRAFSERLGVSKADQTMADLFAESYLSASHSRVDRLYKMDAFRKRDAWKRMASEARDFQMRSIVALDDAFDKTADIGFADIPEELQSSAQGKEIAGHIRMARLQALKEVA